MSFSTLKVLSQFVAKSIKGDTNMPVISRITTQKKNKDRYNIYLLEGDKENYGFSVDETILIEYHLHKGLELDEKTVDDLMDEDTMQKAYNMVIHYLSYRMRTEKEVVDYLKQKEIPEIYIAQIMDKLMQNKLINDRDFAEAFVRTRINTSSKGSKIIQRELSEKGVSKKIADEAIQQYTYDEQFDKAQNLLQKKSNQHTKLSHRQRIERLKSHLIQKGFTHEVVNDVMASSPIAKDETSEWQALIHHGTNQLRKLRTKHEGYQLRNKMKESLYRKGFPLSLIQAYLEEFVSEESDESFE